MSFIESACRKFDESSCRMRNGGGGSRGIKAIATYLASVVRCGIGPSGCDGSGSTTGFSSGYTDNTRADYWIDLPSIVAGLGASVGVVKGRFACGHVSSTRRITPDPSTLAGDYELNYDLQVSRYTGAVLSNTNSTTGGNTLISSPTLTESSYVNSGEGGGVTIQRTGTRTASMWQRDSDGTYWEKASDPGVGWTFYGDVEFSFFAETVWDQDYAWSALVADFPDVWTALKTRTSDFTRRSSLSVGYDDAGAIADSDSGFIVTVGGYTFRTDIPTQYAAHATGSAYCGWTGTGLTYPNGMVALGTRAYYWGDWAQFDADYSGASLPVTSTSRVSTALTYGSFERLIAPSDAQVAAIPSDVGHEIAMGWREDYSLDADWPAPS